MAVSDRTRKILWARSGNRCAICRQLLIVAATTDDPAAVVGEECHITARSPGGPRAVADGGSSDGEDNLILLCGNDHKRVDDQRNTFTVERLRAMKQAHETWVQTVLAPSQTPAPVRLRRKNKGPVKLGLVRTGSDLLSLVSGTCAYDFDHDELRTEQEVEVVSDFLQTLQDYGEMGTDLESAGRVQARFTLDRLLKSVIEAGFFVYADNIPHILEGGSGQPTSWVSVAVRIKRTTDVIAAACASTEQTEPDL